MMKLEEVLTLIKAVSESELTEVKIDIEDEKGDWTFTASKNRKGDGAMQVAAVSSENPQQPGLYGMFMPPFPPVVGNTSTVPPMPGIPSQMGFAPFASQPVFQQQAAEVPPVVPQQPVPGGEYITSPMVGTFYAAPGEGQEPFVSVGDVVKKGQVIGIVEAMKLMNEIEATCDGVVEKIMVEDKAMVGFGDELMFVRTK